MQSVVRFSSVFLAVVTLTTFWPVATGWPDCAEHPSDHCINIVESRTVATCPDGSIAKIHKIILKEEDAPGNPDDIVVGNMTYTQNEGSSVVTTLFSGCHKGVDSVSYPSLEWFVSFQAYCGGRFCYYNYCIPTDCRKAAMELFCWMPEEVVIKNCL